MAELRPLVCTADLVEETSDHVAGTEVLISQFTCAFLFISNKCLSQLISATLCWALGTMGPRGPALRTPHRGSVRGAWRRGPIWS